MSATYYAIKNGHVIELRQTRFREQYEQGREHPHDVCAIAHTVEQLRDMERQYLTGGVDYSAVEEVKQ